MENLRGCNGDTCYKKQRRESQRRVNNISLWLARKPLIKTMVVQQGWPCFLGMPLTIL